MQTDNNTLDRETLSAMLDLTYELEGLIHLDGDGEDGDDAALAPEMEVESESVVSAPVSSHRSAPGTPVFSINDRFLYSRELFGGRVADFEAALKEVASMESFEEAEEYLTSEWGLDPESQTVADFLAVISNYFE